MSRPGAPDRMAAGSGLSSARARFERRAAAARRRPRLVAAAGVGIVLLAGLVAWLGWFSSVLTADHVEIVGGSAAQQAQVRKVAAVPLGGPLMRVDTDAVASRLVADREWTDISVSRSLPHTVVVTVTPRVPVIAIRTGSGSLDLLDAAGFVFRTVSSAPKGVPVVTSRSGQVTPVGARAALEALGALDATVRKGVTAVSISAADQVTVEIRHKNASKTVVWGAAGEAARKARLVKILLDEPGSTIDVSVPASPVTR